MLRPLCVVIGWLGITALLVPDDALACGATCDVPEFWDLQMDADGKLGIVSNFGLIRQTEGDWFVVCEAAVGGGLITSAEFTPDGPIVSTTEGLFAETEAACGYERVDLGAPNAWSLAFESGNGSEYALVLGATGADEVQVLRLHRDGEPFDVLHTLPREDGYRQLSVQGDWLFATGYSFSPRIWRVAYAREPLPDPPTPSFVELEFPAEDDASTLEPVGYDPEQPEALLLEAQTPSNQPSELWRFDASTEELARAFVLEDTDTIVGYAVSGDHQFLAARQEQGGAIYRALRGSDDFEKLDVELPDLGCLRSAEGGLFVCGNDFTRDAPFIVARSTDDGQTWKPAMDLRELGTIDGCDGACSITVDWLLATYGPLSVGTGPPVGDAGVVDTTIPSRGLDIDAGSAAAGDDDDASDDDSVSKSGGCSVVDTSAGRPRGTSISVAGWLLFIWGSVRRRRHCRRHAVRTTSTRRV